MSGRRTDYLTVAEILAIHNDLIERYGGAAGVREFRPQTGYYGHEIAQAAALWESFSHLNHLASRRLELAGAAM